MLPDKWLPHWCWLLVLCSCRLQFETEKKRSNGVIISNSVRLLALWKFRNQQKDLNKYTCKACTLPSVRVPTRKFDESTTWIFLQLYLRIFVELARAKHVLILILTHPRKSKWQTCIKNTCNSCALTMARALTLMQKVTSELSWASLSKRGYEHIHMRNWFYFHENENSFSCERWCIWPRFDREAKSNSEMA